MILEEESDRWERSQGQVHVAQGQGEGLGFVLHTMRSCCKVCTGLGSHFSCEKVVLDAGERAEKGQEHKEAAESSSRASSPQVTSSLNCEPGVFTRLGTAQLCGLCTAQLRDAHHLSNLHMDPASIASVLCDSERLLPTDIVMSKEQNENPFSTIST